MAEAKINREYLLRMCGVSAFMVAICVWSLYDGYVAWPRKNTEFDQVRSSLQATNLTARAWLAKTGENGETPLSEFYSAKGLVAPPKLIRKIDEYKMADNLPGELVNQGREREKQALKHIFESPLYSPSDLQGQLVMAVITALVAGWILFLVIREIPKVYIAGETDLSGSGFGDNRFKYDDIQSMDWKLWDKKGIVKLLFKSGKSYTLDGWHFKGVKDVVETVVENRPDLGRKTASQES